MAVAGTFPEQGVRVALELRGVDDNTARYDGEAFTPSSRYALALAIDVANGKGTLEIPSSEPREGAEAMPLDAADAAFIKQLGTQLWRQATVTPAAQGGGVWARRVQRWRGPK